MIEVSGLVKRYGSFEAVRGVSFTVGSGKIVGLLGPNGAGKTTIMKVLTGYHRPSSGSARVGGRDVVLEPLAVKAMVGYVPESVPLYLDMSVCEYLEFVAEARGLFSYGPTTNVPASNGLTSNGQPPRIRASRGRNPAGWAAIDRVIAACGLSGHSAVRIEKLSKGFRQRVGLAQAMIHDPAILILDEPTTGLDPNQILEIRALIRSLGSEKTVILSTHILQEVEALCSEVLIINEGRIVAQGSATDIAAGMQGDERIECLVKGAGVEALEALRTMPLIRSLDAGGDNQPASGTPGIIKIRVGAGRGEGDLAAEALFDWAVASGGKLLEMRRERLSMEDIFVRLTSEEAPK